MTQPPYEYDEEIELDETDAIEVDGENLSEEDE